MAQVESNPHEPEATSLFGLPLASAKLSESTRKAYEANLAQAQADLEKDPKNVDKYVWVGRRIAYLGRFRESIKWFRAGFDEKLTGTNVKTKLARHLGHRYISLRLFDEADAIFGKYEDGLRTEKDEIEPDGLPNARNTPIGTVHSNFYYHWALAKFLKGDYAGALKVHEMSRAPESPSPTPPSFSPSKNEGGAPDRHVSTAYWLALGYAKLGQKATLEKLLSGIAKDLDILENQSYHRLLLFFKGELSEAELLELAKEGNDPPTIGYGIAAWHLAHKRKEAGIARLREVLKGEAVFAFGYIAAEAELKRLGLKPQ